MQPADWGHLPNFYDPMSTENVTSTMCQALERQPLTLLDQPIDRFEGGGLYAIYYRGTRLRLYEPLRSYEIPIYVGQGRSETRTGSAAERKYPLYTRVFGNHRRSLTDTDMVSEFVVRLLLTPNVHANLGENGLRVFYQPVWNTVLDGFGSNEQGPSTRKSGRSKWDTVHPGRQRSYGADTHDRVQLETEVASHIQDQIARYNDAPWRL